MLGSLWPRPWKLVSGEELTFWFTEVFSLCPCLVEGSREFFGVSFVRMLISFLMAPSSWPYHLPEVAPPNAITWAGEGFQPMNWWRRQLSINSKAKIKQIKRSQLSDEHPCRVWYTWQCWRMPNKAGDTFLLLPISELRWAQLHPLGTTVILYFYISPSSVLSCLS